jgi:hypothetical protein
MQIISRLLEELFLATTLQGVYFIFFAATCFGPCWPSSGGIHNYFNAVCLTCINDFYVGFCILLRVFYRGYLNYCPSQQLFKAFILYFLPLHVSALVGHLQAEYTIINVAVKNIK